MNTEERKEMLCLETADSCVFERAYLVLRTGGETGCDVLNCEMVREAERIVAAARHSPLLAAASAPPAAPGAAARLLLRFFHRSGDFRLFMRRGSIIVYFSDLTNGAIGSIIYKEFFPP